jgi:hypothetical protein
MFTGGLIYLGFRETSLLMFQWSNFIGLESVIYDYRLFVSTVNVNWPVWFVYSMPNVLWLISGILIFDAIWYKSGYRPLLIWVGFFCSIAIFAEIFQYFGVIPGTFDLLDLLPMVFIFFVYCLIFLKRKINYDNKL